MSFTGSSLLAVWSRIPHPTAADFDPDDIKFVEGRVVGSSLVSPRAVMAVSKSVAAILRGVNPVAGLNFTPHKDDFVVPLNEIRGVTIGGYQTAALHDLPVVPGITWDDGPGVIEIIDSSGRCARFKTNLYDDSYMDFIGQLVDGVASQGRHVIVEELFEKDDVANDSEFWDTVRGALRYFPVLADLNEVRTLECIMVGKNSTWTGLALLSKKYFGFFEYDECLLEDINAGNPVILRLKDLSGCTVAAPEDFTLERGLQVSVNIIYQPNLVIILDFNNERSVRLGVSLESYTPEEKPHMERLVRLFLKRIENKLAKRATLERRSEL